MSVFPDDDNYFEYIMSGRLNVFPTNPSYTLKALETLWSVDLSLDQRSEDALNILGLSTRETSERAAFLANYLALEPLITRNKRSDDALEVLEKCQVFVKQSSLCDREAASLTGALAALREESFTSALMQFAECVKSPTEVKGRPIKKFLSDCSKARNRIAHNAEIESSLNLSELSSGLREIVLTLIWTFNRIPNISVDVPASSVSIPEGQLSIRVL